MEESTSYTLNNMGCAHTGKLGEYGISYDFSHLYPTSISEVWKMPIFISNIDKKLDTFRGIKAKPLMVKGKMKLPEKAPRFTDSDLECIANVYKDDDRKSLKIVWPYMDMIIRKHSMYFI